MSRPRAWKRLQKPHIALLVLLAFGMVAQSIIGLTSQVHEFLLHAEAGETYAHQHVPHAHDEDAGNEGTAARSGLHVLLHQPCGGHCGWMDGMHVVVHIPLQQVHDVPELSLQRLHSSGLTAPFRPPKSV